MRKIQVVKEILVGTGKEVAEALGLEPRRFQQLIQEGHIEGRLGRNEYDVARCLSTYRGYLDSLRR
ncbi:hypothetical protein [Shinella pollutisoli]|uniref:DNA-binding protein n=1 Tax=Shinella pollutisoli TaxID=2250594 RepID=A0ABV7DPN7_9HYPH|nr:hypothetical protein [Shinella pollutisoli]